MKKIFLLLTATLFFMTACKEQMVIIPDIGNSDSNRKILIEEFTGGNCSACPQGAAAINDFISLYGEKVIAVSIHSYLSGTLGKPLDGAKYDLRTTYGDQIATYLGPLTAIPSASINRTLFAGQPYYAIAPSTAWLEFVDAEVEVAPELIVGINAEFDPITRRLNVKGNILPEQNVAGDVRIIGYITESHIVDKQLNGSTIVDDYEHNHILRDVLAYPGQSPTIEGFPLATPMAAGAVIPFAFGAFQVPEEDNGLWKVENCHVIVFVVRYDDATGERKVLQADEVDFVE
jgi:Outer membrane protein Omp28